LASSELGVDWLEFCVTTDGETAEAVVELFNRYGRGGAVVEVPVDCFEHELPLAPRPDEVLVKAYLPLDGTSDEPRARLEEGLWHLSQIVPFSPPTIRRLAEEDWANAWKRQYHVVRAGPRTRIVPAWEEYHPTSDEIVIRLEPGMAFGTGLHPTTRLCLQAIEAHLRPGCTVLDVGTGSGVLAIAAAKMGARSVLALDTDSVAVAVAVDNVSRNEVSGVVDVRHSSLAGGPSQEWPASDPVTGAGPHVLDEGRFDLVVINILAPVIVALAPGLAARTAPGGQLIASGLIESQQAEVAAALHAHGFQILEYSREADWVALLARGG
jgi:ribosomal protein L11 methyltransferase